MSDTSGDKTNTDLQGRVHKGAAEVQKELYKMQGDQGANPGQLRTEDPP
jgi:hypothetical protein